VIVDRALRRKSAFCISQLRRLCPWIDQSLAHRSTHFTDRPPYSYLVLSNHHQYHHHHRRRRLPNTSTEYCRPSDSYQVRILLALLYHPSSLLTLQSPVTSPHSPLTTHHSPITNSRPPILSACQLLPRLIARQLVCCLLWPKQEQVILAGLVRLAGVPIWCVHYQCE
jgi:hypothetical protein